MQNESAPSVRIREAAETDVEALVALTTELGFETTVNEIRERLACLTEHGDRILVAERDGEVLGYATVHRTWFPHCPPVGRLTALVVTEQARKDGIGKMLVETAERIAIGWRCHRMEVTSNLKRDAAHAFYERLGYSHSSNRFIKYLTQEKESE